MIADPRAGRPLMPGYGIVVPLKPVWQAYKAKYDWDITGESMFVVRPRVAFAFIETTGDFSRTATRWTFA